MRPDLDRPCRIMVAPNGARKGRADHPALPVSAEEVAATAAACMAAGATGIHLHARDEAGGHTLDPVIYGRYIAAVRDAVGDGLFVQVTTEAVGRYAPAQQMEAIRELELRPDGVSLALRELVPEGAAEHAAARDFFAWLLEVGIEPQLILYAPEELERLAALRDTGIVPPALRQVLFVLGRYLKHGEVVEPRALLGFLERHDPADPWMICAFGREETACLATAAALGGDLRVGFENSTQHGDGRIARDNAARVAVIAELVDRLGRVRPGSA
jgi:3-keto-5-aminohexanoate cleavage enzyme